MLLETNCWAQLVPALHWVAGAVVLAEGLNKLERTEPFAHGLSARQRFVVLLKVAAWICLALGAAGAMVRPFVVVAIGGDLRYGHFQLTDRVSLSDLFVLGGFATIIVRSRFKESHDRPQ